MRTSRANQFLMLIRKLDIFATPVELMIQKQRQHQSLFGAFTTFIMFGCVATYIINKFIQLSQRKEFQTLYSEVYYQEVPIYPLFADNFTLQFAFQTENQSNYIDESVYQVRAQLINRKQIGTSNQSNIKQTQINIPLTRCAKIGVQFDQIQDQLDYVDLNSTYCIDWGSVKELNLTGTQDQDDYTYIYLTFQQCVNSTDTNRPICKSKEQIQSIMHRNFILFQLSSYNIDLRNYAQPQVPKVEEVFTTISSQVMKDITIFMQPITTLTEEGLLDELVRKDSTIRYLKNSEVIDFNNDESLATVIIRLANTENISYRIYPKLQDIFAQAGGLWELLMLFFTILVRPFQQISYKLEIINSLFNFEGQKQEETKEEKYTHTLMKRLTLQPDALQTNENDASIILNGTLKARKSQRFPKGRTKTSVGKQEQASSVIADKNNVLITNSPDNDKLIQRGIRAALRKLFQIANFKIKLNPVEFIKYLKCGQKDGKFKQLQYSIGKLEKCLDILFIIDKLQEIDKMKMILLSKQQMKLFEYLPKPMISLDPHNQQQNESLYYSSLLRPYKTIKEKAQEAQLVLDELLQNLEDPITSKLISLMDPDIIKLLQMQQDIKKNQLPKIVSTETGNNE